MFKDFSIYSFGGHFTQWNHFSNFGKGSPKEHFCESILNTVHWPRRRFCLKNFLFIALVAILFSGVERFSQFWKRVTNGTFL